jgi:DNA-binding MarR family transcriptional regulator
MFLDKVADGSMTPIQYGLLSILATRPNIDQFTIGEELGLDRANVAGILKRLEARKLITRIVDEENRRRKLCVATSKGIALVKQHESAMKDCQIQLLSPLSAEERKIFMGLLSRLVEENNESSRTSLRPNGEAFLSAKPNDSRTARNKGKRKV